jgi:hypothetical protein
MAVIVQVISQLIGAIIGLLTMVFPINVFGDRHKPVPLLSCRVASEGIFGATRVQLILSAKSGSWTIAKACMSSSGSSATQRIFWDVDVMNPGVQHPCPNHLKTDLGLQSFSKGISSTHKAFNLPWLREGEATNTVTGHCYPPTSRVLDHA